MSQDINRQKAQELRKQILSVSKSNITEEEFINRLNDDNYAKGVYKRLSDLNVTPLGANDEQSFLDSLKVKTDGEKRANLMDTADNSIVENNVVMQGMDSTFPTLNKDVATSIQRVELPTKQEQEAAIRERGQQLINNNVTSPKDSVLPTGANMNVVNTMPVRSAEEIISSHVQPEVKGGVSEIGQDKIADAVLSDNLVMESDEKLAQWHKDNDAFITEYERRMNKTASEDRMVNTEHYVPSFFNFNNRQAKEDKDFIKANSAKYQELIRQRDAIQRTKETAETMKQYADFDRSVEVGEQMSSMVDKGMLTEFDMKELRDISDETERKEALSRMYNQGRINEDTLNKILDLGDTSDKSGLWYGMFKTGKLEDFATLGLNELARNTDILDIAKRFNNGLPVNEEEMTLLHVYNKLGQIQSRDRSFGFTAGMGMPQIVQFALESMLTGGVNAVGTSAKQGGKALLKRLAKNAIRQATLTPVTPMMYNDYAQRLTDMYINNNEVVTGKDKLGALYKSYVATFAERFSETLGGIVGEAKLFKGLINNKHTRKLLGKAFDTMSKIADNPTYKTTADILAVGGITDIPGEIASEYSGNIINSIFTLNAEGLAEIFDPEFMGQVALQSVMMGGMGNVLSFTTGSASAALENRKSKKELRQSVEQLAQTQFDSPALESLKGELIDAINNEKIIGEDGTLESGDMTHILSQMKAEITRDGNINDRDAMRAVDNAIRTSVYRYGQKQAVMALVEDKVGEYLNDDGNVYEYTDTNGDNYFILGNTNGATVLINRANGEKKTVSSNSIVKDAVVESEGGDWAFTQFLSNIDRWNQEEEPAVPYKDAPNFTPADKLEIGGVIFDVQGYNPQTNKYSVADEQGNLMEIDPNDEDVVPIYNTQQTTAQQTEETPVSNGETTEVKPEVQPEQEVAQTEENPIETEVVENEIEYDDKGDPVWSKITAERAKQEIDGAFEEDEAKAFVADKIKAAEKAVKTAEKKKPKAQNIRDRKAEIEQIKAERAQAQANLNYWNSVSQLYVTPQTTQGVVEGTPVAEGEVPVVDDSRDNPVDARARGFRSVEGVRYDRQQPIQTENLGNDVDVKFADGVSVKGKRAIIEATEAQPSHIGGMRNPLFFLNEAQPKDRTDKVSIARRDKIAKNIRPEEITGGVTAYTGSPVVNTRKEAIQGNGRLDALKTMYQSYPEQAVIYKQYLIDHAAEFGYDPQVIASMKAPILVDMLDVTDEQAIQLGQRTAQDIESGGEQKISAQNVAQTLGTDIKSLANILLKTEDEEADLNDVISENGYEALKWLTAKKVITETQMQTALDEKGNITTEAREALKDVLSQIIFQGGNNNIRKQFAKLPKAAQKALLQTIARELDSVEDNGILSDIQEAIEVYSSLMNDPDFKAAKGKDALMAAAESWAQQMQMDFTEGSFVPADRYSNFAIALAVSFKAETMKQQTAKLNQLYDYLQAEGGDIFNPAVKLSKEDAIKQVYGVELKDKQYEKNEQSRDSVPVNANQESGNGRPTSTEGDTDAGRDKQDLEQTDSQGAVGDSKAGVSEPKEIDIDNLKAGQVSIETAKDAIDSQKGDKAIDFVDVKLANAQKALDRANKLIEMASKETDIAIAEQMLLDAQADLKFWSDLLNLYNQSTTDSNGTDRQTNSENTQETPTKGTSNENQTGQAEQEDSQKVGNRADSGGVATNEGYSRLGELKTKQYQESQEQTNEVETQESNGRTAEQKQALFDKAKEVFGTTNNFKVAGYMLPDGSLLDFSGRWEGGPGDARYTDHRAIGSGLYEASETDSNYDTNMYDFINQGVIRLMPESAGIYVSQPITEKQEDRLASYIYRNNGEVILEIIDNDGNSISYIEYNRRTSPEKVLSDINNYFEKGIVPVQPEIRYRKKKASDTALPGETPFKGTVISNADEANILKNLDTLAKKYENKSAKNARTFIGDLAKEIGATSKGSDSKYATFRAINGAEFTIRLADHNATVSNFDNNSEDKGISIVISRKGNEGITNDGNANIVEYFYNDKKLRNADGYPLVEIIKSVKQSLYSGQYKDNTGLAEVEEVNEKIYRQAIAPYDARVDSEEVMRESIDKMAQDLGVNAEYVSDENQLDKKGWYDPATGKVYVNLAAHETIDDAKATYLHEVVGHFGLRGLLKDKFEDTMAKIFNSFPKELQDKLLKEYGSEIIAAEEYLASMIENDVEPSLVERILGFIREAIRSMGINLDNYTNGDLEYLLWRSKNNLRENAGHIEAAQWGAKNKEMRYRSVGRPAGYSTNTMEMTNRDKLLHAIQDRMRPVKKLMDEIVNRGGTIDETSDPHSQEFLASSRAAAEIEDFKNERYQPLADAIADAMKVFTEKFGMLAEDARKAVDDYLYARHAPERNKQICVNEIVDAGMEKATDKALVDDAFKAEVRRMAGLVYDNQFRNGKNIISPNGLSKEQIKLAMAVLGAMNKKTIEISKETVYDEATGQKVLRANNRSGMSDAEAEGIMKNLYTTNTKAVLDKVSARVKDCTDFTLDKWLEYGLISKEEYDSYKNQYEYYIPLRGWEEKGEDIDYMAIPTKQFNAASNLVTLNKKASGRTSKAENPLAYIASLAQSACVTGNKNLIRQQAFRMVEKNEGLIDDLAVIENTYEIYDDSGNIIGYTKRRPSQSLIDQGRVKVIRDRDYAWHKTASELGAHRVPVLFDGVVHMLYFKGEIGALAATAINGTDRDTTHILTQTSAKATRWISSNLTAKNVYFLGKNLMRDLGFGNFAYFVENGAGKTLKLNRYFLSAMRTAAMDAMGADPATFADSALYEEFKLNGGQTGYIQMESLRNLSKQMDKLIKEASKDRGYISQQAVNAKDILIDTFDVLGKASENAMRFAIYKLEREKGSSPREAAIRAKEITVNFNRQGKNTKGFSAVYAFFNPAVQGAYRYAKLAKTNPGRFIGTTAALMAIKFGLGVICELFSDSDDDDEKMKGESAYDRLSDYVKATNWVIPLGGWTEEGDGKFLCIPMPQSVRGATHLSDLAVDVMFGRKDFGEAVKDFAMFNIGEFLPFDIDAIDLTGDNPWGTLLQAASPTILRPIVENVINRDFMGNPISKEPFVRSQDYIPQYQLAFRSTSPILVGTSKFLNELAGGDEKRSARYQISQNGQTFDTGWSILDINPAKIEHLFSGYFGGMFKPVLDVYDTMRSMADKDIDTDISSVALVNQFIKGPTSKPGYKKFYELRDEAQRIKSFKDLYKDDYLNEVNWALNGNKYNYEIYAIYEVYSDIIKMYNENIMLLNNNRGAIENYSSQVKELEKERDKMILEAASKYRDICERRDKENKEQE